MIFYHGTTNEMEMIKKECKEAEEQIEQKRGWVRLIACLWLEAMLVIIRGTVELKTGYFRIPFSSWKGFAIGAAAAASYAFTADDLVDTFSAQILSVCPLL